MVAAQLTQWSQRRMAEALGISQARVCKLVASGMPLTSVEDARRWRIGHVKDGPGRKRTREHNAHVRLWRRRAEMERSRSKEEGPQVAPKEHNAHVKVWIARAKKIARDRARYAAQSAANESPRMLAKRARAAGSPICLRCRQHKPLDAFVRRKDGAFESRCMECKLAERRVAEHAAGVKPRPTFPELEGLDRRERKNAYQRMVRRKKAAAEGRKLQRRGGGATKNVVKCAAHVKAWKAHCRALALENHKNGPFAHVDAYRRERYRLEWHEKDKHQPHVRTNRIARRKKAREQLSDQYIVRVITDSGTNGIRKADIPPELIEAQRLVLKIKRATKERK